MKNVGKYSTLSEIQIGAHKYSIWLVDAATVDGDDRWGETALEKNKIKVSIRSRDGEYRPLSTIEDTLLHEILHAVSHIYNCDLSENQTLQMTQGVLQVLKQYGLVLVKEDVSQ